MKRKIETWLVKRLSYALRHARPDPLPTNPHMNRMREHQAATRQWEVDVQSIMLALEHASGGMWTDRPTFKASCEAPKESLDGDE